MRLLVDSVYAYRHKEVAPNGDGEMIKTKFGFEPGQIVKVSNPKLPSFGKSGVVIGFTAASVYVDHPDFTLKIRPENLTAVS